MKLKNYVPFFISNIKEFQSLFDSEQIEIDNINLDLKELLNQFFISTATFSLTNWEEFVGINTNTSKSIEERRSRILAKLRGQGTTTKEVIKTICESFYTKNVEVIENPKEYEFIVNFVYHKFINFKDILSAIEEVKPAHLNFKVGVENSKNLNLETEFKTYNYALNMCGTFNCGTIPDVSNSGLTFNENLNINSNSINSPQKYIMCGNIETGDDVI